jgi:hypothetical protein
MIPNTKKALVKNPNRTTGNRLGLGESLFFHAVTRRSGLIRISEVSGFFEAYVRWFEE